MIIQVNAATCCLAGLELSSLCFGGGDTSGNGGFFLDRDGRGSGGQSRKKDRGEELHFARRGGIRLSGGALGRGWRCKRICARMRLGVDFIFISPSLPPPSCRGMSAQRNIN